MRKLAIDYGDARVGIAITDELNIISQGLETIHHNNNDKRILKRLDEILELYDIDTFIVGMPINMNGTEGPKVEKTQKFINKLRCKYNKINIETIDERLSTVSAYKTMNDLNVDKKKRKEIVDTIAAQYILEIYLRKHLQNN